MTRRIPGRSLGKVLPALDNPRCDMATRTKDGSRPARGTLRVAVLALWTALAAACGDDVPRTASITETVALLSLLEEIPGAGTQIVLRQGDLRNPQFHVGFRLA